MRRPVLLALALCALAMPLEGAGLRPLSARPSALYTPVQATEGARVYAVRCAMCHGAQLGGSLETPGLKGRFMANWSGRPVADLYDYVSQAMPQPAPGSLSAEDNARLLAFLLRENGLPAGERPLPAERRALERLTLTPVVAR